MGGHISPVLEGAPFFQRTAMGGGGPVDGNDRSFYVLLSKTGEREMIRGSCLCGAVAFELSGTPRSLSYCHCSRCRKTEGVFAAVLIGSAGDFALVRGGDQIARLVPESPWTHARAFCRNCGSALGEMQTGNIYVVAASALDDDPGLRPTAHLNVGSKPAWYEIDDGLKKFEGNYIAPVA